MQLREQREPNLGLGQPGVDEQDIGPVVLEEFDRGAGVGGDTDQVEPIGAAG